MRHACHAIHCDQPCPPRHLMCSECWSRVGDEHKAEVWRQHPDRMGSKKLLWLAAACDARADVAIDPETCRRQRAAAQRYRQTAADDDPHPRKVVPDGPAPSVVYVVMLAADEDIGVSSIHADRAAALAAAEAWCREKHAPPQVVVRAWDTRTGEETEYHWKRSRGLYGRWSEPTIYDPEVTS